MATRKKSSASGRKDLEDKVRASAHRIWLAGLGAFALAEEEGGRLFKSLVDKGETLESIGREQFDRVKEEVGSIAESAKEQFAAATGEVRERAGDTWKRVEREVDDRVASALEKVGVPSKGEISRLTRRIEELTVLVEKQAKRKSAGAKPAGAKRAARRPTTKRQRA